MTRKDKIKLLQELAKTCKNLQKAKEASRTFTNFYELNFGYQKVAKMRQVFMIGTEKRPMNEPDLFHCKDEGVTWRMDKYPLLENIDTANVFIHSGINPFLGNKNSITFK
ncbi:MAG TPA: hypothetical protein VIL78_07170 [Hanamia sp.]